MAVGDGGDSTTALPDAQRRTVIRDSLGVGFAVGLYGFAFGAASVAAGLSVLQTCLLSLLAFTGGTQFAIVGVVAGGGSVAAALTSGLLLGARNTLYAMRMAPVLAVRGPRRWLAAMGTIDETTAMAVGQRTPALSRTAFWSTFAGVWVFWNLFTFLGAVGASALGDPKTLGLDAVVPAAFLALVAPRLRTGVVERWVAVGGALIALLLIPFVPPGVPVLAAAGAVLIGLVWRGPAGTGVDPVADGDTDPDEPHGGGS